jgi:hypothetical protein
VICALALRERDSVPNLLKRNLIVTVLTPTPAPKKPQEMRDQLAKQVASRVSCEQQEYVHEEVVSKKKTYILPNSLF